MLHFSFDVSYEEIFSVFNSSLCLYFPSDSTEKRVNESTTVVMSLLNGDDLDVVNKGTSSL